MGFRQNVFLSIGISEVKSDIEFVINTKVLKNINCIIFTNDIPDLKLIRQVRENGKGIF